MGYRDTMFIIFFGIRFPDPKKNALAFYKAHLLDESRVESLESRGLCGRRAGDPKNRAVIGS